MPKQILELSLTEEKPSKSGSRKSKTKKSKTNKSKTNKSKSKKSRKLPRTMIQPISLPLSLSWMPYTENYPYATYSTPVAGSASSSSTKSFLLKDPRTGCLAEISGDILRITDSLGTPVEIVDIKAGSTKDVHDAIDAYFKTHGALMNSSKVHDLAYAYEGYLKTVAPPTGAYKTKAMVSLSPSSSSAPKPDESKETSSTESKPEAVDESKRDAFISGDTLTIISDGGLLGDIKLDMSRDDIHSQIDEYFTRYKTKITAEEVHKLVDDYLSKPAADDESEETTSTEAESKPETDEPDALYWTSDDGNVYSYVSTLGKLVIENKGQNHLIDLHSSLDKIYSNIDDYCKSECPGIDPKNLHILVDDYLFHPVSTGTEPVEISSGSSKLDEILSEPPSTISDAIPTLNVDLKARTCKRKTRSRYF
jgi:hypothetical protein